jgi:hypothetical protein
VAVTKEVELLVREKRSEKVKRNTVADVLRGASVDILDAHQREVFVAFSGGSDFTGYSISGLERIAADLTLGYIYVVWGIQVIIVRGTKEAVSVRHYLKHACSLNCAFELDRGRLLLLLWLILGPWLLLRLWLRLLLRTIVARLGGGVSGRFCCFCRLLCSYLSCRLAILLGGFAATLLRLCRNSLFRGLYGRLSNCLGLWCRSCLYGRFAASFLGFLGFGGILLDRL